MSKYHFFSGKFIFPKIEIDTGALCLKPLPWQQEAMDKHMIAEVNLLLDLLEPYNYHHNHNVKGFWPNYDTTHHVTVVIKMHPTGLVVQESVEGKGNSFKEAATDALTQMGILSQ